MRESYASLDAHAYVDDSLSATDRASFEAAMRRDAKLRARVEAWQAQNEAIRLAFGASPKPKLPVSLTRHSNENALAPRNAPSRAVAAPLKARPPLRPAGRLPALGAAWRRAGLGGLAFVAAAFGFAGGPPDPRAALMQRAETALRAVAPLGATRLDFPSDDPVAVSAWLAPRFARLLPQRITPPGWSLLGVRIVPGWRGAAALVLFEDAAGERAGLLLEPDDALPVEPSIAADGADELEVAGVARGFAYAAVGPRRAGVAALAPAAE
jgi:anti-sigma factor RsiW